MTISAKIKSLLKMQNAEHAGLAEHLGISKQALSNKFFRDSFSGSDLIKVADYLKCKLCFISGESQVSLEPSDLKSTEES